MGGCFSSADEGRSEEAKKIKCDDLMHRGGRRTNDDVVRMTHYIIAIAVNIVHYDVDTAADNGYFAVNIICYDVDAARKW